MTGRVVIVTGASCGLGYEVARQLCEAGNDVILASHDEEQTKAAIDKIKVASPGALATFIQCDVSSLESVRKFVDEFHATGKKLNVLVNCAGLKLTARQRQYSADNFELSMAANHLGHFLLTNLLLSDLKNSSADGAESRVIVVSSALHDVKTSKLCKNLQPLDLDNMFLFNDGTYNALQAYKNSRTANIMFAYELARHVQDSGIKVCAVCPNFEPASELTPSCANGHRSFTEIFMRCVSTPETAGHAAAAICQLITDEKFKDVTGKYMKDGEDVPSSEETMNEELQSKLWQLSARYVRLDGFEPLEVVRPAPEPEPAETPKKEKKAKPAKKTKNEKNAEEMKAAEAGENGVVENGHGAENGKEGMNGTVVENGHGTTENGVQETTATEETKCEENGKETEKVNGVEETVTEDTTTKLPNGDSEKIVEKTVEEVQAKLAEVIGQETTETTTQAAEENGVGGENNEVVVNGN